MIFLILIVASMSKKQVKNVDISISRIVVVYIISGNDMLDLMPPVLPMIVLRLGQ
jgi:hypothetical protein